MNHVDHIRIDGSPRISMIEASAGTGKTYTITNLYLRLILGLYDRPYPVDEILVLTFTIAATEELRERIRRRLGEARAWLLGHASDDATLNAIGNDLSRAGRTDDGLRLTNAAIQLMDEAAIFTIHGFCGRVLRDKAFETRMLFDVELNAERDTLVIEATRDFFRAEILTLDKDVFQTVYSRWSDPEALAREVSPFLFRSGVSLVPPAMPPRVNLDELKAAITAVKELWSADDIPRLLAQSDLYLNHRALKESRLIEMGEFCLGPSLDLNGADWPTFGTTSVNTRVRKKGSPPEHRVFELCEFLARGVADWNEQIRCNLLHKATSDIRARINAMKIDQNQLTPDDLLIELNKALSSERGAGLASVLAAQFPIAMVDEFQDTDDVQYGIFRQIQAGGQSLFCIGDPKQAIYQFRGADIFTYVNAKRRADDLFALEVNYRSTDGLVAAVNGLFDKAGIFGNDRDIPFQPVTAAQAGPSVEIDGAPLPPMTLFALESEKDHTFKVDARNRSMAYAAQETVRLLESGRIAREPVAAGQIAFLVRDRYDAKAARDALAERAIKSVYVTLESVFLTETATDLLVILKAILDPTDERLLKAAIATHLVQSNARELEALNRDVIAHQEVLLEFDQYHRLWASLDIAPMVESLIERRQLAEKWLPRTDGERQITNLRHLSELLQQRSLVAPGMHRLVKWFAREQTSANTVAPEERQLRLESDRNLVQIVTMHSAKGLEYDIVMIPMAGFRFLEFETDWPLYHPDTGDAGDYAPIVDLVRSPAAIAAAREERLQEDMRLLYVAITRARYAAFLGVANIQIASHRFHETALARILRLDNEVPTTESMINHLRAECPSPLFDVIAVPLETTVRPLAAPPVASTLREPPSLPSPNASWSVFSYTQISQPADDGHRAPAIASEPRAGFGDDDPGGVPDEQILASRHTFARGARVGIMLHYLLEELDFHAPPAVLANLCETFLTRYGFDAMEWQDCLVRWMADVLTTPVTAGGFRLCDVTACSRELAFHFPIRRSLPSARISQVLADFGYQGQVSDMTLRGMMTGIIDLAVEHDGKAYVLDYKSNYLGPDAAAYDDATLRSAMAEHNYPLQYFIYSVALCRYLRTRNATFDYDTDFGGIHYLFLRGMEGSAGAGIFSDRPPATLIAALDELFE